MVGANPVRYQWHIFLAALDPTRGAEQAGRRPVLVISREKINQHLSSLLLRQLLHPRTQAATGQRRGEITLDEMTTSVRSWIAHAAHGDTWRLRTQLFADYPIGRPG